MKTYWNPSNYNNLAGVQEDIASTLCNWTLENVKLKPWSNICDICSGTGFVTRHLAHNNNQNTFGIDISSAMLKGFSSVSHNIINAPCESINISGFDVVMSSMGMHWIDDIGGLVSGLTARNKVVVSAIPLSGSLQNPWYKFMNFPTLEKMTDTNPAFFEIHHFEEPETSLISFLKNLKQIGGISPTEKNKMYFCRNKHFTPVWNIGFFIWKNP